MFTQTVKKNFNHIITNIVIAWAFITFQRIKASFQRIFPKNKSNSFIKS